MDRFSSMAIFVKVVEGASFAGAARAFGLSPAAVSKQVQALEAHLGVRLLHRTTRRVTPTEVGLTYYHDSLRILADLDEADRTASNLNTTPRGILKVSAPITFGNAHVAPAIADYLASHPDVSVDLSLDDRLVDLLEEGFDVAIRTGDLPDSTLIARRLMEVNTVLCASPRYLQRRGEPRVVNDLVHHNCLIYSPAGRRAEWRFVSADRAEEVVSVSGRFIANNGDVLRVLALHGEGIVRLPAFIVESDLAAGRLVRLLSTYEARKIPVHAVYPHGQFLSAKVRSFLDFLTARFAKGPLSAGIVEPAYGSQRLHVV